VTVSALDLAGYQRAVRTLLSHPLITESYPDASALPLVRRWVEELHTDLLEAFGYRLELTSRTARLIRILDDLDPTQPAKTGTDRPFDRRRYAYLALTLAALGRAGVQISLSELAGNVADDARRIDGLGLSTERATDRSAFVDAVAWLETRGAVRLADGSARRWVDDPESGEALYDIDRDVVAAVYRPTRVLQHVGGVSTLVGGMAGVDTNGMGRDVRRREAAQRARRALVELPVVYLDTVEVDVRNALRGPHAIGEVERLTGMVAERRAEGIALLDTSGTLSDIRFPGSGTVAQAALLLIGEIAARIAEAEPARLPYPGRRTVALVDALDQALPRTGVLHDLALPDDTAEEADQPFTEDTSDRRTHPLVESSWLGSTMTVLMDRYGATFAARWRADPERLQSAALALLADLGMIVEVDGGILVLPLLARYREVAVQVRPRQCEPSLFDEQ
jgi:uncharacterized protein (TIGR02678 family)